MTKAHPMQVSGPVQTAKQILLSLAVVGAFSAYTIYEHFVGDGSVSAAQSSPDTSQANLPAASPTPTRKVQQTAETGVPTAVPPATSTSRPANTSPAAQPSPTVRRVVPTATPVPTNTPAPVVVAGAKYKDGVYVGDNKNAVYGIVQVKAVIQGGQLTSVDFLNFPADRRTSQRINEVANPMLQSEAIKAQSYQVDMISGATLTSRAFIQSLQTALAKAKP